MEVLGARAPRTDAAVGVTALRRLGVGAVMLTGDNERTGFVIADKLGLDVRAGLLPADKLCKIAALQAWELVWWVTASPTRPPWLPARSGCSGLC